MGLVKICPACGCKNPISECQCIKDGTDISDLSPVDENDIKVSNCNQDGKIKLCPSCGEKNLPDAPECVNCSWSLVDVPLTDELDQPVSDGKVSYLILSLSDGQRISAVNGDIIGREGVGSESLVSYEKVSRTHARITSDGGKWFIEDLGTTNGTYINNARIPPNKRIEIIPGHNVSMSKSCVMVVSSDS
jgi:hypothetical protein